MIDSLEEGPEPDNLKPKLSGDLLLVIEVSRIFSSITQARIKMNAKSLILLLESASLLLTGYYKKGNQKDIRASIQKLHPKIDTLVSQIAESGNKSGSSEVWSSLYDIEQSLRQIWHDSGLQVGKGGDYDGPNY
jgi:hypothetical protein